MGTCKYCGQSAGLFSRAHKECEERHDRGLKGMGNVMRRFFSGTISADELKTKLEKNRLPYFLTDEDVASVAISTLRSFGENLKRPYPTDTLSRIKASRNAIAITYTKLNEKGDMDALALKMFQGYVVDFFAKGITLSQVIFSAESVAYVLPLSQQKKDEAVLNLAQWHKEIAVYNVPLCLIPESIHPFAQKSLSDWKNKYFPECDQCPLISKCCRLFATSKKTFKAITPIV